MKRVGPRGWPGLLTESLTQVSSRHRIPKFVLAMATENDNSSWHRRDALHAGRPQNLILFSLFYNFFFNPLIFIKNYGPYSHRQPSNIKLAWNSIISRQSVTWLWALIWSFGFRYFAILSCPNGPGCGLVSGRRQN